MSVIDQRIIEQLEKENAALDKQKEYLKKQGDELAITVSNLVIENKALKERLEEKDLELKALFENEHQTEINGGNERIIAQLKEQLRATVENATEDNHKLRNQIEKLKQERDKQIDLLNQISFMKEL